MDQEEYHLCRKTKGSLGHCTCARALKTHKKDPQQSVTVLANFEKYSSEYTVSVIQVTAGGKKKTRTAESQLKRQIGAWFDDQGNLAAESLYKDLKSLLEGSVKKTE